MRCSARKSWTALRQGLPGAVVVDDDEASRAHLVVEGDEGVHCRFVEITIETEHGDRVDRGRGERVGEPTFEKTDSVVEQFRTDRSWPEPGRR